LRDPQIVANLEGFQVCVGFQETYRNGSYTKRNASTTLPDMFTDANGQCSYHEVCIILSDNRANSVAERVELHHLRPVAPWKKGDWIVILCGDHQGVVAEVIACKQKTKMAEVVVNGAKLAFNFSNTCRLLKPV
jgi:hypothetical protein